MFITSEVFLSLLGPIIEDYRKEIGGIVIGSVSRRWIEGENRPAIVITNIFPNVTAKRKGGEWEPNLAARGKQENKQKGKIILQQLLLMHNLH